MSAPELYLILESILIMTSPYVLGFVGENANDILLWWSHEILKSLSRYGLGYEIVDLRKSDAFQKVNAFLQKKPPTFCFSFQGMGMNAQNEQMNAWSSMNIPFISYLGDNPYHMHSLHAARGKGLYLLYSCRDFLQTYTEILQGKNVASLIRYPYPTNIHADEIPWNERPLNAVFVKTAVNTTLIEENWNKAPKKISTLLYESSKIALGGSTETITSICSSVFDTFDFHYGENLEFFLSACSMVDHYVRAMRAERMVRELVKHDAFIVGDWSYLDCSAAKARFVKSLPAHQLNALYSRSKITISTQPCVQYGVHERIMGGLMAKSAVISDASPFVRDTLKDFPAFFGLNIDSLDFPERFSHNFKTILEDADMPNKTSQSGIIAEQKFSIDAFIDELLEYIQIEVYRRMNLPAYAV